MATPAGALNAFRATAKKAMPTNSHRPALWENMLGTVYARNAQGVVRYFDYDYAEAIAFIGPHHDVRVSRVKRGGYYDLQGTTIEGGKLVWFVVFGPEAPASPRVEAYGVKGVRSTAWRKTFRSVDALNAWAEENDAEIQGTREVEASR